MSQDAKTFHESWYRIANQKISLRPSVKVTRQLFRGERWYVLTDSFANTYYRLRPHAYEFIARLNMNKTVSEVWEECIHLDPENSPGQEEVINLLAQLYHANLLHYELAPDSAKLFDRFKKRKNKIMKSTLSNIMFFRLPLFDPDKMLQKLLPFLRICFSYAGGVIWLFVVFFALKLAVENFSELTLQSEGILAPSNLFLLYFGMVIIKSLHEFGHSFTVRHFGGEVHTMGVMFLLFNPVPYMDATAAWSFRSKWKRVLVGAAGMLTEVFVAALFLILWANTGPGVIHSLSYNIIFIASVSTVLFNINPLLRFDGYYILSDILDIPNLHTQAFQQLTHLLEYYAFGLKTSKSPAKTNKEAFWLTLFGILSNIYRIVVFTGILLFVADRFLLAGMIMAALCAVSWLLVPLVKFTNYLIKNQRIERVRVRAITVSLLFFLSVFTFLNFIPFPNSFKAAGIIEALEYKTIVNNVDGIITKIAKNNGERVKKGDTLIVLANKDLMLKEKEVEAKITEAKARLKKARINSQADILPINTNIESLEKQYTLIKEKQADLNIKAEIDGIWVAPDIDDYMGILVSRGRSLGELINDEKYFFNAIVTQKDANRVFSDEIKNAEIKINGHPDHSLKVTDMKKIPMELSKLPSMVLGFAGGGEIALAGKDREGTKTKEPFYAVHADFADNDNVKLYHRRSGKIRFKLPMEPLLKQWWRLFRQMLQKRYKL